MSVRKNRCRPYLGAALAAAFGCWAGGCGEPPLSQTPIAREVLVADLLADSATAGRHPKSAKVKTHRTRTELPEDGVLHLRGRVWRHPEAPTTGAITFTVEAEGRTIFSRRMQTANRNARFTEAVPLMELSGRQVELTLSIEQRPPDGMGIWERATVHRLVPTPRLEASQGRNLLLVVVDTLRADHMSLYGYPRTTTPHLDDLATEALVFDNAIAPCSRTAPSVASLLTGLYPLQHQVIHGEPLGQRFTTLGERLQASGLTTFAVSANRLVGPAGGYAQGFETFVHAPRKRVGEVNQVFLDWLDTRAGLRWFAYLHYFDPHDPYDAPAPTGTAFAPTQYNGVFSRDEALNELFHTVNFGKPPAHRFTPDDIAYLEAAYDGEILYWDEHFAALVQELRRRQLLDNTVLILTSDHGEEFTEHGKFKHGHQLFEESVRVPLVIRAPGVVPAGRRQPQVENRGVAETATRLLGLTASAPTGPDLLEIRDGNGERRPAFIHTEHRPELTKSERPVVAAVRDNEWKLIEWLGKDRVELFNLADDPGELTDLAPQRPELAAQYRQLLQRWLASDSAPMDGDEPPPDPELLEKLRALGYVQ